MTMLLLHMPTATGPEKQVAVNSDEILRMEEVEGGTTQIIQMDKGPTTVKESLPDILEALGEEVAEVKPKPEPKKEEAGAHPEGGAAQKDEAVKRGQPIGQAHPKAGGR